MQAAVSSFVTASHGVAQQNKLGGQTLVLFPTCEDAFLLSTTQARL
jgi:hypothetical protein